DVKHKHGRTALHLAVFAGRIGFVHLLLSSGSDSDLQDDSGHSPWDWARRFNRPVMEMRFSNDPKSEVFLGTQSSQDAELPLQQAVSYGSSPRANVNCKDKDSNTPLWLSTYSSCDEITERLLAEKEINVNFVGGRGRFETPSTSLHHAATRLDTVILRRLLEVPGIDPNLCVAGHPPISVAAYHGRMNTVACLLSMEGVEINGRDMIDPPICRAVAHGHLDVIGLLVYDLEMVQALLRHDRIDVNLRNRWFEDPLMLAVKAGHLSIVDALVVNPRLKNFSLKRSLDLARNDCIQRAIRSRMEHYNAPQT
ncbi:unnamed protein product, partial [Penicillium salamii]